MNVQFYTKHRQGLPRSSEHDRKKTHDRDFVAESNRQDGDSPRKIESSIFQGDEVACSSQQ